MRTTLYFWRQNQGKLVATQKRKPLLSQAPISLRNLWLSIPNWTKQRKSLQEGSLWSLTCAKRAYWRIYLHILLSNIFVSYSCPKLFTNSRRIGVKKCKNGKFIQSHILLRPCRGPPGLEKRPPKPVEVSSKPSRVVTFWSALPLEPLGMQWPTQQGSLNNNISYLYQKSIKEYNPGSTSRSTI